LRTERAFGYADDNFPDGPSELQGSLCFRGGVVFEQLRCAVDALRSLVGELEPDRFDGPGARTLVELFDEVERLGAAGKALATRQVVATGAWRHDGAHRDAASWLAGTTGATVGAARATVDTAARVAELPATEAVLRAGSLSFTQVDAIADAATADPAAEAELLERATHDGVRGLRTACARVKAAACTDEAAQYERISTARSVRSWTDPDGTGRIDVRGPVDATAKVMAALEPFERALFEEARREQRRECSDALAFDALVALASAKTSCDGASPPSVTTVVRVDYSALLRGATVPGEVCEMVGAGPIPVSVAQRMLDDCFLKVLLVDGTDVLAVSHPGRTIPARLRSAVEERSQECDIEGCHVRRNLEIDHNLPVEEQGPTALWNLHLLCCHHHVHKHRYGLRLVGEHGRMRFVPASEWAPP
jgi:hypothetical protein